MPVVSVRGATLRTDAQNNSKTPSIEGVILRQGGEGRLVSPKFDTYNLKKSKPR
jgi:hypothetical protein